MSKIITIFFAITLILVGTWTDSLSLFAQENSHNDGGDFHENSTFDPFVEEEDTFVRLIGSVLSKPDNEIGLGLWTIQDDDDGSTVSVFVDEETDFLAESLLVGGWIAVEGILNDDDIVQAIQIDLEWEERKGILLESPEDPSEPWVLEDGQKFFIDSEYLDTLDRAPIVGEWIVIEGYYINESVLSVDWIEFELDAIYGIVTQQPEEGDVLGEWHLEIEVDDDELLFDVTSVAFIVDEETDFLIDIPAVGQSIYIEGSITADDKFHAQLIDIERYWFFGDLVDIFEQDSAIWWVVESIEDGLSEILIDPELMDSANPVGIGQEVHGEAIINPDGTLTATWLDDAIDELILDEEKWDWLTFSGTVTSVPDDETGIGYWSIEEDGQESIDIFVADIEILVDVIPQLGDQIYVGGYLQEDGVVWVEVLNIEGVGNQPVDVDIQEVTGVIRSVPVRKKADNTQVWVIETDKDHKLQIRTDDGTTFYPSKPTLGEWVNVMGIHQSDGSFLAWEIALDTFEVGEVVVHLASGVISQTVISRYNLNVASTILAKRNAYIFTVPNPRGNLLESIVARMQEDGDIEEAYLNYTLSIPVETVEANPHQIWHWSTNTASSQFNENTLTQINLGNAHDHFTGEGQIVAVLDTGVDPGHSAWKEGQIMSGLDLIDHDDNPDDDGAGAAQGHGTHISGVIVKIAPDSRILPVRVLDGQGRGDVFDLAYGIEWAAKQGADVINLSLGTTDFSPILWESINYVVHEMGVIVVAAAGNSSNDKRHYPAAFANTLSVTAVDEEGKRASFANYGQWVEMAAPGTGITSTIPGPNGTGYGRADGTSMATPFVSGAAVLLREKTPDATRPVIANLLQGSPGYLNDLNPDYQNQLGSMLNVSHALGLRSISVENDGHTETQDTVSEKEISGTESLGTEHILFLPLVKR